MSDRSELIEYLTHLSPPVPDLVAKRVAKVLEHASLLPHTWVEVDEQPMETIIVKCGLGFKAVIQPRHDNPIWVRRCQGCGLTMREVIRYDGSDHGGIPCLDFQLRG